MEKRKQPEDQITDSFISIIYSGSYIKKDLEGKGNYYASRHKHKKNKKKTKKKKKKKGEAIPCIRVMIKLFLNHKIFELDIGSKVIFPL